MNELVGQHYIEEAIERFREELEGPRKPESPDSDIRYLSELDKKVRQTHTSHMTPNMSGQTFAVKHNYFPEVRITKEEMEKILRIVKEKELLLRPDRGTFNPIYTVSEITPVTPGTVIVEPPVLTFADEQLPESYNFKKLSEYFPSKQLLDFCGLPKIEEEESFRY